MTRTPSPTRSTPTSWVDFKDLARRQYESGDYEAALRSYTSALNPELQCPASEKQIVLSNLIACRLKIGGEAQARAAVENAKQCVELNPQWAKGHVRLASAYIALGGHSNDACNSLQRALSIDPGNSLAREFLIKELRRDHAHASRANSTASAGSTTSGSVNNNNNNNNNNSQHREQDANPPRNHNYNAADAVDESLSWQEWLQFHMARAKTWYQSQSDDVKTFCKIAMVVLVLYVAFGGRFGFEKPRTVGNYDRNNNVY